MSDLAPAGEAAVLTALMTGRFIAAFIGDPQGAGVEVSGGSYARVAGGTFSQTGTNPTTAANDAIIEFAQATADWGLISHVAVFTASSGGSLLASKALDVAKQIDEDDVLRFPVGQLEVEAD